MANFLEEYTMLDEIGRGGFATVYKVRHDRLGYIRAIRVLNETIIDENSETYQKFLDECRLLLRLGNGNHNNIVHIYQPRLLMNKALVEMDFVDGCDLTHYIERQNGFLPIDEVLRMVSQISSALSYCHYDIYKFCMDMDIDKLETDPHDGGKILLTPEKRTQLIEKYRVIHNDIHSGNIMRRENGDFILLDFGLAIEGNEVVRSSRRRNGAPEYKPPEKWDDAYSLSVQSDIYSFGIVMYEYLTGKVPFEFDKTLSNTIKAEYELSEKHQKATPPSIFERRKASFEKAYPGIPFEKDYPDWLEEVILRCLEKDPKKRFANAKELYNFVTEKIELTKLTATPIPQDEIAEQLRNQLNKLVAENESLKSQLANAHTPMASMEHSDIQQNINQGNSNDIEGMKRCPHCGHLILTAAKFCKYCGEKVPVPAPIAKKYCHNCGAEMNENSQFCKKCGSRLVV